MFLWVSTTILLDMMLTFVVPYDMAHQNPMLTV